MKPNINNNPIQVVQINSTYRADIDGLRAIAVLLVIGFHVSPLWIKAGFIGVDIFFVISGFLITKNITEKIVNNKFNFYDFYSSRARRIFPALILILIFNIILGWFFLLGPEYMQLGKHIAGGASFIENILYLNERDYFDASAYTKPLLNLWSLGVEEQFYIFWPFAIWCMWLFKKKIYLIILTITLLSFLFNIKEAYFNQSLAYYSPFTRLWELGIGSLLVNWQFKYSKYNKSKNVGNITSVAGALLILTSLISIDHTAVYPGLWAAIPVFGAALILISNNKAWLNNKFLSNKLLVSIGLISFPLYLWHWTLLCFFRIIYADGFDRTQRIVVIILSFIFSWLTYKYLEKSFRYGQRLILKTRILYLNMFVVFICGVTIYSNNGFPYRSISKNYDLIVNAFNDVNWTENLNLLTTSSGINYYQTNIGLPKIAFVGDSHIKQFGPIISELSIDQNSQSTAFYTIPGCPPIPNVYEDKHPQCNDFISEIDQFLNDTPSIETIVIGACWNCYFETETSKFIDYNNFNYYYLDGGNKYYFRNQTKLAIDFSMQSLKKYLLQLSTKYKVYFLLDNPMSPAFDPRSMIGNRTSLSTQNNMNHSVPLSILQNELNNELKNLAASSGVTSIDQLTYLCPENACIKLSKDGVPIYSDNSHLRPYFVKNNVHIFDNLYKNQNSSFNK